MTTIRSGNIATNVFDNTLPAYVPSPGNVKAISTNFVGSVGVQPVPPPKRDGPASIFNFGTGIVAPEYGTHGALVIPGQGAYHYWGSEIYLFDPAPGVQRWQRIVDPHPYQILTTDGGLFDPAWAQNPPTPPWFYGALEWRDVSGNMLAPTLSQLYGCADYFPPTHGGPSPSGAIFMPLCGTTPFTGTMPHSFDLTSRTLAGWKRGATGSTTYDEFVNGPEAHSVFHKGTRKFVTFTSGPSQTYDIFKVWYVDMTTPGNGVGTHGTWNVPAYKSSQGGTATYWPTQDVIIGFGMNATRSARAIWYFDPNTPTIEPKYVPIVGDIPPTGGSRWGFAHYDLSDCFYGKPACQAGGVDPDTQFIYKLQPPGANWKTSPWTCTRILMGGDSVAIGTDNTGVAHRFGYIPRLACMVWCNGLNVPVYAYRPNP